MKIIERLGFACCVSSVGFTIIHLWHKPDNFWRIMAALWIILALIFVAVLHFHEEPK
jgi:hypothetical protein